MSCGSWSSTLLYSGPVLLLVAHPDDESIGAGILMQRNPRVQTVIATSGAPNRPYIWRQFGTPGRCARIRQAETNAALSIAGAQKALFLGFPDGRLYRNLGPAYERLVALVRELKPELILTHAVEAGHPDHDCCSFLSSRLSEAFGIPAWEMPYYRPDPVGGSSIIQQFETDRDEVMTLQPTTQEIALKQKMFEAHASQHGVLTAFDPARECFRPQPDYDYSRVACGITDRVGPRGLNARDLAAAFQSFSYG